MPTGIYPANFARSKGPHCARESTRPADVPVNPSPTPAAPPLNGSAAPPSLGADLLEGAEAIAEFFYGDRARAKDVYYASTARAKGTRMPLFKNGGLLCARRSAILAWIVAQEEERCSASAKAPPR
jgi:hypothetical protein